MQNAQFAPLLKEFADKRSAESALALIMGCKPLICSLALHWREPNLSLGDKIKEIMAEMLLILLENFDLSKLKHENSVYKYLALRLRSLTRPKKSKLVFEGLADSSELGRCGFSASKLSFVNEIVSILRSALFACKDKNVADLEFLFMHICPETRWISALLASANGADKQKQAINDRQRHSRFKILLKESLKQAKHGDISEITLWSGGERSHLAWQIINIAPCEISLEAEGDRQRLDVWRESINPLLQQPIELLTSARRVYSSMKLVKKNFISPRPLGAVSEEPAPYGQETDIFALLLGRPSAQNLAAEDNLPFELSQDNISPEAQKIFNKAANHICQWFENLNINKINQPKPYL